MEKGTVLGRLLSLFYPSKCTFCKEIIPYPALICSHCTPLTPVERCPICSCSYNSCTCSHAFSSIAAPYQYEGRGKNAILRLKTKPDPALLKTFAQQMALRYDQLPPLSDPVLIVPIPASEQTMEQRGYNQAELLALYLGKYLKIPVKTDFLLKNSKNPPQHTLDSAQRWINASDSFAPAAKETLEGYSILLVDDICTTGATLDACAQILKQAGAQEILALTATCVSLKKYSR